MTNMQWCKVAGQALIDDVELQTEWDRLNAAQLDLPFMSAAAVGAALRCFGSRRECLFIAKRGTNTIAMLLLTPQSGLRWRTFQPSQLPLGAWVALPDMSLGTLCRALLQGPLAWSLAVSVTQVDPLASARSTDDAISEHADYIDTAWVDISGTFVDYWAARGKNLRQNMRKQRNRLAAAGTSTHMRIWRGLNDMAPALARYGALESAGWKASRGTAIHPDNAQGRFYAQILENAAQRGEAMIFEYLFDERTVAIDLCLMRAGTLVVLKTTYDESVPSTLSPAFLLREEELQAIFDGSGIRRIEYYGKVMDWHTKLTESRRTLYHGTFYRWPLIKRLAQRRRHAQAAPAGIVVAVAEMAQEST